jgi:hypothetical protein
MSEVYEDVRSADLRFEWPHALAEMVKDSRSLAADIANAQATSCEILDKTSTIHSTALAQLLEIGGRIQEISEATVSEINSVVDVKIVEVTNAVDVGIKSIEASSTQLIKQSSDAVINHTQEILRRTTKLLEASDKADKSRIEANDARMRLMDYRTQLDVYEATVLRRCREALANAGAGLSLWGRIKLVFSPEQAEVQMTRPPPKPVKRG